VRKFFSLSVLLIIFPCLLCGCDGLDFLNSKKAPVTKKAPVLPFKGTLIGKVGNVRLTLEDLNQDIVNYNRSVPDDQSEKKISTREQKIDYVKNEMVRRALLYQEALSRNLDQDENIVRTLEKTKIDLLALKLMRDETDNLEVTPKEIEDTYNTYKDQFKESEARNIREIVVNTEQEATDVLVQLLQGADFATLANERSKSSSSKNGGDLGFINKGSKFAQFDEVAFSETLEAGKTSNVFKGPDGYYILKLEAKKGGKQKVLSDVYENIKETLLYLKKQKKIEDLINQLSKANKMIEINEGEIR
jgi:peptidyl-prolyl cis-trans isomerase C